MRVNINIIFRGLKEDRIEGKGPKKQKKTLTKVAIVQ